jgi:hypothetical protein
MNRPFDDFYCPWSVRVVGPSGTEWYLDALGERNVYDKRRRFTSRDGAEAFMQHSWAILTRTTTTETVESHYRAEGFLIDVVNMEGE